jgi:hypothetical protein
MINFQKTILTLLAICLAIGYLWYGKRTISTKKTDWNDVKTEAAMGGYRLIRT